MPYVFCPIDIPARYDGLRFSCTAGLRAFLQFWAIPANIAFAHIFPISFTVSGITENLVLPSQDTIKYSSYRTHTFRFPFFVIGRFGAIRWDFPLSSCFPNPWRLYLQPVLGLPDHVPSGAQIPYRMLRCHDMRSIHKAPSSHTVCASYIKHFSSSPPWTYSAFGQWWILPEFSFPDAQGSCIISAVSFHVLRDPLDLLIQLLLIAFSLRIVWPFSFAFWFAPALKQFHPDHSWAVRYPRAVQVFTNSITALQNCRNASDGCKVRQLLAWVPQKPSCTAFLSPGAAPLLSLASSSP